jgi:hypothetical protein
MTGAAATLLLDNSGTILAIDALHPETDVSQLCEALMSTDQALSRQMGQAFGGDGSIRQSYLGTETYNLCTYRFDEFHVVAVVFGPAVKEGQVWYYIRDAISGLTTALAAQAEEPAVRGPQDQGDVFDMLDQFFPDRQEAAPIGDQAAPVAVAPAEQPKEEQTIPAAVGDLPSLEEIDWDVPSDADWDALVADTDQGLAGITFEEAQRQGLVSADLGEQAQATPAIPEQPAASPPPDLPPIDEIDWQVSTDMDWDAFIADTDKGLEGISFEEAKKRGLIDSLQED